jgi:hypothetical protein
MTEKIIMSVVSIAMLFLTLQRKKGRNFLITGGMAAGILLTLINNYFFITAGWLIYLAAIILSMVYIIGQKEASALEKLLIFLTGLIMTIKSVFTILQLPMRTELQWIIAGPVVFYIMLIFETNIPFLRKYSFMTILFADALISFLSVWF